MAASLMKRQNDSFDDGYDDEESFWDQYRTTLIIIICVGLVLKIALIAFCCYRRNRRRAAREAREYDLAPPRGQSATLNQLYGNPQYNRDGYSGLEYPMTSYYGNPPQYEPAAEPRGVMSAFASKSGQYQPVARGRALSNEDNLGVQGFPSRDTSAERLVDQPGQQAARPLYG